MKPWWPLVLPVRSVQRRVEVGLREVEAGRVGNTRELGFDVGGGLGVQAFVRPSASTAVSPRTAGPGTGPWRRWARGRGQHPGGDVVTVLGHRLDALGRRDEGVGVLRGQVAAGRGAAGLAEHRPLLGARDGVERAAGLEERAREVDVADLRVIGEVAGRLVEDEHVGVPGVPQWPTRRTHSSAIS